ncbi:MAG: helix-turn-helix domain-containing protein [Oscillospiraceae bacterium]|jgi:hypothetical protein|nr:helix-turn-helix domain-containing protein [Oscillospiraceae bacterium]
MKDDFVTVHEIAARWNISIRQVQKLCLEDKIPGVFRFGNAWAIPQDAPKPTRTGKLKPGRKTGSEAKQTECLREGTA